MDTLVVGAAGRTGAHILRFLLAADLGAVRGLVRRPEHTGAIAAFGAEPVLGDVDRDLTAELEGIDAVVCAIGASRPEDADAIDHQATVRLARSAEAAGVARFLLLSSMGTDDPTRWPDVLRPFLEAKAKAEAELKRSGLAWTIVRPGALTDAPGVGLVEVAPSLSRTGSVPREDVARVAALALRTPATVGAAFDVLGGDTPVADALRGLGADAR